MGFYIERDIEREGIFGNALRVNVKKLDIKNYLLAAKLHLIT